MSDVQKFVGRLPEPRPVTQAVFRDYLTIARFDHMTKHVFIIPGLVLGYAFSGAGTAISIIAVILGFASAILIASANYALNEWLDRSFDAFHPVKSQRTAVHRALLPGVVYTEYGALLVAGLALAYTLGWMFFVASVAFAMSGVIYNVEPIRTKDRTYLDVISESVNNPIRLILGWAMVAPQMLPPASLLLAYWSGGAFLMGAKRLSEYRDIVATDGVDTLRLYRRSFQGYTSETLTVSCFFYAMMSAFFIAIFLVKYRIEYVIAFPFLAGLFSLYLWLSFRRGSIAQRPERLFRSRRLMVAASVTTLLIAAITFINIPALKWLSLPYLIQID